MPADFVDELLMSIEGEVKHDEDERKKQAKENGKRRT
jgi:hypothetical protein